METPSRASMDTVNAVPKPELFSESGTIIERFSRSSWFSVMGRQISPRPNFAMKLTASGGHGVGRHAQVTLVLTILVVDEDHHPSRTDFVERVTDADDHVSIGAGIQRRGLFRVAIGTGFGSGSGVAHRGSPYGLEVSSVGRMAFARGCRGSTVIAPYQWLILVSINVSVYKSR